MLESTTSRELAEAAAYDSLDPGGEVRGDIQAALVACTIANANRGRTTPPYKIEDFMPDFERKKKQPDLKAKLAALHAMMGTLGK